MRLRCVRSVRQTVGQLWLLHHGGTSQVCWLPCLSVLSFRKPPSSGEVGYRSTAIDWNPGDQKQTPLAVFFVEYFQWRQKPSTEYPRERLFRREALNIPHQNHGTWVPKQKKSSWRNPLGCKAKFLLNNQAFINSYIAIKWKMPQRHWILMLMLMHDGKPS